MLHGRFLLLNSANIRHPWTLMEIAGKLLQLLRSAYGVDVDAPIVFIAHPASQSKSRSLFLDKPTEADALHATGNEPAPGLMPVTQVGLSAGVTSGFLSPS